MQTDGCMNRLDKDVLREEMRKTMREHGSQLFHSFLETVLLRFEPLLPSNHHQMERAFWARFKTKDVLGC